jgi:putative ABC transport system permease protein
LWISRRSPTPIPRFTRAEMFVRLVRESFVRNPRRKLLTAAALMVGMAVATATLTVALEVGDRLAREFRSLGANLIVSPESDSLPVEIGGIDYRPVDEGAYLKEADLGKLKMIFWRHNVLGFTPFLDVPTLVDLIHTTLIGTWYQHELSVPDGTHFTTGLRTTHPWWGIQGRWFHDGAKECVLGHALAAKARVRIGETIQVSHGEWTNAAWNLTVTGIVSAGGAEDNAVIAPLSLVQEIAGHRGQFRQLFVSALTKPADALSERNPDTMTPEEHDRWFCSPYISSISFQIQQVLPGTDVRVIRRVADTEGRILTRVSALLWIITFAALLSAALAVAATSAATILERRFEVGIMKAIGATNSIITGIFLAEQLMVAVLGGIVGFAAGIGLARLFGASVFGSPAPPRLVLLPVILGIAAIVALVGSLIPLRRAARLDPAPILRGE